MTEKPSRLERVTSAFMAVATCTLLVALLGMCFAFSRPKAPAPRALPRICAPETALGRASFVLACKGEHVLDECIDASERIYCDEVLE
jgi:hypothetical protein